MKFCELLSSPLVNDQTWLQVLYIKDGYRTKSTGLWFHENIIKLKDQQVDNLAWSNNSMLIKLGD